MPVRCLFLLLLAAPALAQRPAAHPERLLNAADLSTNGLRTVRARYPGLLGQGLTVSIKEGPLDPTDIDFRGRLLNTPAGTVIQSAHASIMTTLVAGAGNSGPGGEGAAPQARLAWASYDKLGPDPSAGLSALGVSVQNHSYGTGIENFYGLETQGYDQQARDLPTLLHVFSAGNLGTAASPAGRYQGLAGWANLTGQFKQGKNTLSVGAADARGQVALLSARGPAYDGRVKPELVAAGDAGSSDAAALVSGAALLVQQAYRDRPGAGNVLPTSDLVRAALLNSAFDVGRPQVDFEAGFGQLDALGAVRTVAEGRYWQGSVAPGQSQTLSLPVPAGTWQLKITLTWIDPAAAPNAPPNATPALVNDLDLRVGGPGGAVYLPWTLSAYPHPDSLRLPARRRADHLNTVEQITVEQPVAGAYQLRVSGAGGGSGAGGPQAFGVAYELLAPGLEWRTPGPERDVRPGQPTLLRWAWAGPPPAAARLDYRPVGAAAWRPLAAAFDPRARALAWTPPDTTTLAQVRAVVDGRAFVSDTFALARPLALRVGYVCPALGARLSWAATPGATIYQVFTLGPTQLMPLQAVADTVLLLTPAQAAGRYFAVAPRLGRCPLERGPTADLTQAGVGCYVRTWLARQPLADTVRLDLTLGTLAGLRRLQVQRQAPGGGFETIQTLSPVARLRYAFLDPDAQPGPNFYRVLGDYDPGQRFVSDTVVVQRVGGGELLVFPVPARAGQDLQVAGAPGQPLALRLYDARGRLVRTAAALGALNPVSTSGLPPGLYLLRATPAGGGRGVSRRVVLD